MTEWIDIPNYEELYQVSNTGRVRSLDRLVTYKNGNIHLHKGRVLKLSKDRDGYVVLDLWKDNIAARSRVHRLVCLTYHKNPENKSQVNHKNGIKDDNRVENLEWATVSENNKHAYDTGLNKVVNGINHYNSKLNEHDVSGMKYLLSIKWGVVFISKLYNVSHSNIIGIRNGRTWKHVEAWQK